MNFKGNVTVEEGRVEVETVGERNNPQVRVTIPYTFSGVDLSEFLIDEAKPDYLDELEHGSDLADKAVSEAEAAIRKHVMSFYGDKFKEHAAKIANTQEFVGMDADISIFKIEQPEDLKNCQLEVQIHCFYDVPVSDIEKAIEGVKNSLLGK